MTAPLCIGVSHRARDGHRGRGKARQGRKKDGDGPRSGAPDVAEDAGIVLAHRGRGRKRRVPSARRPGRMDDDCALAHGRVRRWRGLVEREVALRRRPDPESALLAGEELGPGRTDGPEAGAGGAEDVERLGRNRRCPPWPTF